MSSIAVNAITDADGGNTASINGATPTTDNTMGRNRVINGAMEIAQRGTAAVTTGGTFPVDRWQVVQTTSGKCSVQQNANAITPPVGFTNYLGVVSLSAYSLTASDYYQVRQKLEGFNVADFDWGTANARPITVSFWVYSSLTGNFGLVVSWGSSSSNERTYPILYSITSANTWEYKTITISGDTTMPAGGFETGNGSGIQLRFSLGGGATNAGTSGAWATANYQTVTGDTSVVSTNGATFYITGVQLETGSVATSFERRQYGQELALCQRYYYRRNYDQTTVDVVAVFSAYSSGGAWGKIIDFPVEMRATPTASLSSIGHFRPTNTSGSSLSAFTAGNLAGQGTSKTQLTTAGWSGSSGMTAGNAVAILNNTTSAWIDASAEL